MSSIATGGVQVGDELPPFEVLPDFLQNMRYCGLTWSISPLMLDADYAREMYGAPGPVLGAYLKTAFLYQAVKEWLGDAGWIGRDVRAAHRLPDSIGRRLTVTGRVSAVYEEGGARRADVELRVINVEGAETVRGTATVEFR